MNKNVMNKIQSEYNKKRNKWQENLLEYLRYFDTMREDRREKKVIYDIYLMQREKK